MTVSSCRRCRMGTECQLHHTLLGIQGQEWQQRGRAVPPKEAEVPHQYVESTLPHSRIG